MGALVNQCIPFWEPANEMTCYVATGVLGKHFVTITANAQTDGVPTIGPPSAGGRCFGVAAYDAIATKRVAVHVKRGLIVPVITGGASGAMAANLEVQVDATGAVVPFSAGVAVGRLITGTAGNGADAVVQMY